MEFKKIKLFICSLFWFCSIPLLQAQSDVNPNPAQKKALDKAIPKIIRVLDEFNSGDWKLTSDFYDGEILVNIRPSVPIDINQNFERIYQANQNSPRFQHLLKPVYDRINELMNKHPVPYDSVTALGNKAKNLSNVTVYVYINRKTAEFTLDPKMQIKIPGVAIAQKVPGEYFSSDKGFSYYLCFGNWANAKTGEYGLNFKFQHPNNTPFIENIVVIFFGANDRVQELLKQVDWKVLDDALTL